MKLLSVSACVCVCVCARVCACVCLFLCVSVCLSSSIVKDCLSNIFGDKMSETYLTCTDQRSCVGNINLGTFAKLLRLSI